MGSLVSSKIKLPSVAEMCRCFEYEACSGRLLWRHRSECAPHVNSRFEGREAGSVNNRGYRQIELDGVTYCTHRIIFKMHHGYEPHGDVDHRDTDTGNNRVENLRDCSHQNNGRNSRSRREGLKGTTFRKRDKRYYAQISEDKGRRKHLGSFATEAEAHAAYCAANAQLHGEFGRTA